MRIDDILRQLKGVRRLGPGRYIARCCAHDDRHPSLSIKDAEGKVLLHCFSGCSYESLASALGIDREQRTPQPYVAPAIRAAIQDPPLNADAMWRSWFQKTDHTHLDGFAMSLGVDTDALKAIGCAWADRAWAFPMRHADGRVIGIRLRDEQGRKWAVKGSKSGLFIPAENTDAISETGTLWIVEGPTDLAAALTIGLAAIGRAACLGQEDFILEYLRIWKVRRLVIISDNDEAGLRGAAKLQTMLKVPNCLMTLPCKDVRDFVRYGGDYLTINSMVKDLTWTMPKGAA